MKRFSALRVAGFTLIRERSPTFLHRDHVRSQYTLTEGADLCKWLNEREDGYPKNYEIPPIMPSPYEL